MSQKKPKTDAGTPGITPLPITALKPYGRNARKHGDKQVDLIARSIREFGFNNPVLIDRDRNIVAGHGRFEAAMRLGLDTVPTVLLDHLSEAQVRAYRIADNRIAELSDWDEDLLRLEIADLVDLDLSGTLDFDVSLTGFETAEFDILLSDEESPASTEPERVDLPDPADCAVSRTGDLWVLGKHRILCGDALDPGALAGLLGPGIARLVFTDPLYNVRIAGHVSGTGRHREFAMASGEMSAQEFEAFLTRALDTMAAAVVDGGILMVYIDWRHLGQLIAVGEGLGLRLLNLCIWNKTNGGMGSLYRSKHEEVCIFKKGEAPHVNNVELGRMGRYRTNVRDYAGVNTFRKGRAADLADHPTVKPVALVMDAIKDVTHRGDIVLDPFGGSGTTLLAAERTGRRAWLVEIDPLYVDVTIRRWQALTGNQAVHAEFGETWNDRAASVAAADDSTPETEVTDGQG
ncbi:MAG: DNA methylase N-4 [Rhodobacteraceae bacterium]|nr:DNA methylase N-4 [Paracoccaceae bacterium]